MFEHHRQKPSRKSKSPPSSYQPELVPGYGIPPQSKAFGFYENERRERPRKSYPPSDLPPSYETAVSQTNHAMESKRKDYLQQKLTHLKKQNSTTLEHFQIVRDDIRQSKELMEKQILHNYTAMKTKLESLLQESLNNLQEMESEMLEPLDAKLEHLQRNLRTIDMNETVLARQPYSESVKEKIDSCLKMNLPPPTSDIDIYKLTDSNNFPLLRLSTSFLDSKRPKSMNFHTTETERLKSSSPYDFQMDDTKSDLQSEYDFDYTRDFKSDFKSNDFKNPSYFQSPNLRRSETREDKKKDIGPSDSVIQSYKVLEDLYSSTKNCADFKGSSFQ